MSVLAISALGAVIGNAAGIGIAALGMSGAAVGWTIGSLIGNSLQKLPGQEGPRLDDLSVAGSTYGAPIVSVWGRARVPGTIIWAADLIEISNTQKVGGKGGPSQKVTTYSYYADFAVQLGAGPKVVKKIFADNILIYDISASASAEALMSGLSDADAITVYEGTETQNPDPLIESYQGVGNVPAFRGSVVAVFNRLDLTPFGNRIPSIRAELSDGTTIFTNTVGTISASMTSLYYAGGIIHSSYYSAPGGPQGWPP